MSTANDVSAARSVAFDLVRAVLANGKPYEDALAVHDGLRRLPGRDKGFARLISATTLRRLGQIDLVINGYLEKPLPKSGEAARDLMRIATAEMLFLGVAPHAAVDSAVTLVESRKLAKFKGLANAVLRKIAREGREKLASTSATANFPDWMVESWVAAYGETEAEAIAEASLREPPLDVSVSEDVAGWAKRLGAEILPTGSLRRAFDGAVPELPGFADGKWWVQDAAAALPAKLLGDVAGKRVVELCAAPGGKTAQLIAAGAKVTAVDRSAPRLRRLERNLTRLGMSARVVIEDATKWRPKSPVDAVLLDPPCTSSGTIRRHPDILHSKNAVDVETLAGIQKGLLSAAAEMVKPGGTLVYCTCSIQPAEGEDVINAFLGARDDFVRNPISADEVGGLTEVITEAGDLRTLPSHFTKGGGLDGFYAARLTRA